MKKVILRFLCCFCAAFVALNSFIFFGSTSADTSTGKMSSVYAYILNDYIETYGVLSTDDSGAVISGNGSENPCGVIYGDLVSFDKSEYPYLVLFVADGDYGAAACHIWRYSPETEKAERTAVIAKRYSDIPISGNGEMSIANDSKKGYITYSVYDNGKQVSSEFYTVADDEAVMYINNPTNVTSSGIAYFNGEAFNSAVDISGYNKSLDKFFSRLKDSAAQSVTHENILTRVDADGMTDINRVLLHASLFTNFDIRDYASADDYDAALKETDGDGVFMQASALYDLGDGIYYAVFDTKRSRYNYALIRKSDTAEHGYQILKARTDCIPLADKELEQIKLDCMSSPLIYDMSLEKLTLSKKSDEDITVKVGASPTVTLAASKRKKPLAQGLPTLPSMDAMRLPAACIGGGFAIALLSALWVYLYSEN